MAPQIKPSIAFKTSGKPSVAAASPGMVPVLTADQIEPATESSPRVTGALTTASHLAPSDDDAASSGSGK